MSEILRFQIIIILSNLHNLCSGLFESIIFFLLNVFLAFGPCHSDNFRVNPI